MSSHTPTRGLAPGTTARLFADSTRGVAAVEFAIILPLMVAIFCGMCELTIGYNMSRKMIMLTRTLADLTARARGSVTTTKIESIFSAASVALQPYDASAAQLRLSSIEVKMVNGQAVGTVKWSCAKGKTILGRDVDTTYPVPLGFEPSASQPTTAFVLAETELLYKPYFGTAIKASYQLGQNIPWPVRNDTAFIPLTGACPTYPAQV